MTISGNLSNEPKEVQEWQKGGFSSCLASNEITTRGYMALTFAKCITRTTLARLGI
jgi:hypothetical protein